MKILFPLMLPLLLGPLLAGSVMAAAYAAPPGKQNFAMLEEDRVTGEPSKAQILVPTANNKSVQGSNFSRGIFLQAIWFDLSWNTSKLKKPAEMIKGFIVIADALGEPKMRFVHVIRSPLLPGQIYTEKGVGFEYEPSDALHKWVRTTDLQDMRIWFEVSEIGYADGSVEKF